MSYTGEDIPKPNEIWQVNIVPLGYKTAAEKEQNQQTLATYQSQLADQQSELNNQRAKVDYHRRKITLLTKQQRDITTGVYRLSGSIQVAHFK